jgi:hypothetical protein
MYAFVLGSLGSLKVLSLGPCSIRKSNQSLRIVQVEIKAGDLLLSKQDLQKGSGTQPFL